MLVERTPGALLLPPEEPHAVTATPAVTAIATPASHRLSLLRSPICSPPPSSNWGDRASARMQCRWIWMIRQFDTFQLERFKYYGFGVGVATHAKRGRPATASRADVLRVVTEQYLGGRRVDLTVVARELGLSRATIYRWFGSREALLGEIVATQLELLVARKRREVRRR